MSSFERYEVRAAAASGSGFRLSLRTMAAIVAIVDLTSFVGSSVAARTLYSSFASTESDDIGFGFAAAIIFTLLGRSWGFYRLPTLLNPERNLTRMGLASLVGVVAVVCLLFLFKTGADHSRFVMALFALIATFFIPAERVLFARVTRLLVTADIVRGRPVVLIGERAELERLAPSDFLHFGLNEIARFGLSPRDGGDQLSPTDRLRVSQAMETARGLRATEFALVVPWSRDRALKEIITTLRLSPLPVRLYPDSRTREVLLQKRESNFDPYLSVEVQRKPLGILEQHLKRAFDVSVAAFALIWLCPLLILCAILIKIDSRGPVIFRQSRRGFDNREFRIWKFRTMNVLEDGPELKQAQKDDDRVTKIGRLLRRTSIDELPQLVNVLKGDMSIVGPRPHAVAHDDFYEAYIGEYALRRHVKPGLTGAAQVRGLRGETRDMQAMEARIQRDLWYINHWSLWLDVKIVAHTFAALFQYEAY